MGRGIRVHNRACWLNSLISPSQWLLLLFVAQVPSGAIHLLYAGAIILFARRILAGAPRFVS